MSTLLSQKYFKEVTQMALSELKPTFHLNANYYAESSQFTRLNQSKIRQSGHVLDGELELQILAEKDKHFSVAKGNLTLCGSPSTDKNRLRDELTRLQSEAASLPIDPFVKKPEDHGSSTQESNVQQPDLPSWTKELLDPLQGNDFAAIFSAGPVVRGMFNSSGLEHYFQTDLFSFDFSLFNKKQKAVKGTYAGTLWDSKHYLRQINKAKNELEFLNRTPKELKPGKYRTYLAPGAVVEILNVFAWGGISEFAIRQGESPLLKVRSGEKCFSNKFTLEEDFSHGRVPRFNSIGELSEPRLTLIKKGQLKNALVSNRTAMEYNIPTNAAEMHESLRAPHLHPGILEMSQVHKSLKDGLYLSNLHYLNWSDRLASRITGMTRYACFWVENGEISAPIENLRFDDTLFNLFGENLEEITNETEEIADINTYFRRGVGISKVPGVLLKEMSFTL